MIRTAERSGKREFEMQLQQDQYMVFFGRGRGSKNFILQVELF